MNFHLRTTKTCFISFLLACLGLILFSSCKKKDDGVLPEVRQITRAVYASGYIIPENEYQVFAQSEGVITDILKREGELVHSGEVIIKIRSTVQDAKNRSASLAADFAGTNAGSNSPLLEEATATLSSVKNKFYLDSLNFVRYQNLSKSNSTSGIELDKAELNYKNAANELRVAKARLKRLQQQTESEYAQALALLSGTGDEQGNTLIRSLEDGLIYQLTKEKGELVRRGEVIARIGSSSNVNLKLSVDEEDYPRVEANQKVLFTADAYGKKTLQARVIRKYPFISKADQSFRVDAMPIDSGLYSISGAAAEANILVSHKKDALVIPASYLTEGDSLLIDSGSGRKRIKVKTGISDLEYVEILEGITSQTRIFKE